MLARGAPALLIVLVVTGAAVAARVSGGSDLERGPKAKHGSVRMHHFKQPVYKSPPKVPHARREVEPNPPHRLSGKNAPKLKPPHGPSESKAAPPKKKPAAADSSTTYRAFRNTVVATSRGNVRGEPTVTNDRYAILYTANRLAAISSDNGMTFQYLDPADVWTTTDDDGWCCDQLTTTIDRGSYGLIVWVQQSWDDGYNNHLHLNVYRGGSNLVANNGCELSFDAQDLGYGGNRWLDFPQIAASDKYLYLSANVYTTGEPQTSPGAVVWRTKISDLDTSDCDTVTSADYQYEQFPLAYSPSFAEGGGSTMYFAYLSSLSQISLFKWKDSESSYEFKLRGIDSFPLSLRGTSNCKTPDGNDPCKYYVAQITSGVVGSRADWIFMVPDGGGYDYPNLRVVRAKTSDLSVTENDAIYSQDHGLMYPDVAVNDDGHAGGIYYRAGGGLYPTARTFLIDDVAGSWELPDHHAISGGSSTNGPADDTWGDYSGLSKYTGCDNTFDASFYTLQGGTGDSAVQNQWVWFGRERDACPDLAVTGVNNGTTRSIDEGSTFSLSETTTNLGSDDASASTTAFYLSRNAVLGSADTLLASVSHGTIADGSHGSGTVGSVVAPAKYGTFYVIACADDANVISEITNTNNCLTSTNTLTINRTSLPNFHASVHDVIVQTQKQQKPGGRFPFLFAYHYYPAQPPDTSPPEFHVTIYLSLKPVIDTEAIEIAKHTLDTPIPPNPPPKVVYADAIQEQLAIPASVKPGAYYVGVCPEESVRMVEGLADACTVSMTRLFVIRPYTAN